MTKYKIVHSTKDMYNDIELPLDTEDVTIGCKYNMFGDEITITQVGSIISGSNSDVAYTLQEVVEEEE